MPLQQTHSQTCSAHSSIGQQPAPAIGCAGCLTPLRLGLPASMASQPLYHPMSRGCLYHLGHTVSAPSIRLTAAAQQRLPARPQRPAEPAGSHCCSAACRPPPVVCRGTWDWLLLLRLPWRMPQHKQCSNTAQGTSTATTASAALGAAVSHLMYVAASVARRPSVWPFASMMYHRLVTLAASARDG